MWDFWKDPDTWLSIASVGIAALALFQSHKQIKLSNKQQLFEKRLDTYLILEDLSGLYRQKKEYLDRKRPDQPITPQEQQIDFIVLTSNHTLDKLSRIILSQNRQSVQALFLSKMDDLELTSQKLKFVFPQSVAADACEFIDAYKNALLMLYTYDAHLILIDCSTSEEKKRQDVFDSYERLKKAFVQIEEKEIEKKMADIIRL